MRYEVDFANPKTGETRVIAVQLALQEIEKAEGQDLVLRAYAVRHAYREAPAGFLHVAGGQRPLRAH